MEERVAGALAEVVEALNSYAQTVGPTARYQELYPLAKAVIDAGYQLEEVIGETTGSYLGVFKIDPDPGPDRESDEAEIEETLPSGRMVRVTIVEAFAVADEDRLLRRAADPATCEVPADGPENAVGYLVEVMGLEQLAQNAEEYGLSPIGGTTMLESFEDGERDP